MRPGGEARNRSHPTRHVVFDIKNGAERGAIVRRLAVVLLFLALLAAGLAPESPSGPVRTITGTSTRRSGAVPVHIMRQVADLAVRPSGRLPALLAAPASTTSSAPTTTTSSPSAPDWLVAAWARVAVCEEGGWVGSSGWAYPDSLGISRDAWFGHGGGSDVSPAAQAAIGQRVVASIVGQVAQGVVVYPGWVPDQGGCHGAW